MSTISSLLGKYLFIQQLKVKQSAGGGGAYAPVTSENLILTSVWTCCSTFRDLSQNVVSWSRCCASLLSNGPAGGMLGTARPAQNSAGVLSSLQSQLGSRVVRCFNLPKASPTGAAKSEPHTPNTLTCMPDSFLDGLAAKRWEGPRCDIPCGGFISAMHMKGTRSQSLSCLLYEHIRIIYYLSITLNEKTHLKSVCLQYQLYQLLNSHCFCLLKNGMGLIIFFLCAYVPKTEAGHCKWAEVLKDLERIETSKDIDVSLYTANADEDEECQELVMRCFFLEIEVIIQECRIKNCSKTQDVWNIWKNGNESFGKSKLTSTKSEKCKECEEYEEKNFTEFVHNFVKVIQRDCKH